MRRRMTKKKITEKTNPIEAALWESLDQLSPDEIGRVAKLMLHIAEKKAVVKKKIGRPKKPAVAKKTRQIKTSELIIGDIPNYSEQPESSPKPQDGIFVINPDKNKASVRPRIVQAKTGDTPKRKQSAEERLQERRGGEKSAVGTVAAQAEDLYIGPRENKFLEMPEAEQPNDDAAFDKLVAVKKPVPRGGREANLVEKECEECGDVFTVNPSILTSKRFVCNDCIVKKGKH